MNKHKLFVASCLSLATASMVFAIRGDVAGPLSQAFRITNEQMGLVFSPAFWAFTIAIFISGNLVDIVGMRRLHILSAIGFVLGVALVVLAPHPTEPVVSLFDHTGTTMLYAGFFMLGLSHGLVEGVINPLMAALYPDEKTRRITSVHAWWPAGLIIGGLLAILLTNIGIGWQLKLGLILVPAVTYLVMALSVSYPKTERVMSNVSTGDMWKEAVRPLFLLLLVCMCMTAAIEMGPDQWFPRVMGELVPQLSPEAGSGVFFLVYTGGLMFALRMWGSNVTHKSPIATMIVSSLLSAVGLYWLGALDSQLERGRRADCRHALRHRQNIPLADDDRHHRGTISPRWRASAVADGRHRPAVGRHRAADHGRAHGSIRSWGRAADGRRARRHPDGDLHGFVGVFPIAGRISRRCHLGADRGRTRQGRVGLACSRSRRRKA